MLSSSDSKVCIHTRHPRTGQTAAHICTMSNKICCHGKIDTLEVLVDHGANLAQPDSLGVNIWQYREAFDEELYDFLAEYFEPSGGCGCPSCMFYDEERDEEEEEEEE